MTAGTINESRQRNGERDQPPSGGCTNCGGPVRWQKEHPTWGKGWFCSQCVKKCR